MNSCVSSSHKFEISSNSGQLIYQDIYVRIGMENLSEDIYRTQAWGGGINAFMQHPMKITLNGWIA